MTLFPSLVAALLAASPGAVAQSQNGPPHRVDFIAGVPPLPDAHQSWEVGPPHRLDFLTDMPTLPSADDPPVEAGAPRRVDFLASLPPELLALLGPPAGTSSPSNQGPALGGAGESSGSGSGDTQTADGEATASESPENTPPPGGPAQGVTTSAPPPPPDPRGEAPNRGTVTRGETPPRNGTPPRTPASSQVRRSPPPRVLPQTPSPRGAQKTDATSTPILARIEAEGTCVPIGKPVRLVGANLGRPGQYRPMLSVDGRTPSIPVAPRKWADDEAWISIQPDPNIRADGRTPYTLMLVDQRRQVVASLPVRLTVCR